MQIIIPGETIAKKNSQRIVKFGRSERARRSIRPSAAYDRWEKNALEHLQWIKPPHIFDYPIQIYLFHFRKTKRKFDLSNMIEGVQDVLQKAQIIDDDSMTHVIPVIEFRPGVGYGWAIDKKDPRVEICIEPCNLK